MVNAPYKFSVKDFYLKALIYGDPGVGKTSFAAEAMDVPSMNNVLFLNIEGGLLTIAGRHPDVIDIGVDDKGRPNGTTAKDLEDVVFKIVSKAEGFAGYKTVVLDSATELQTRDLEDVTKAAGRSGGDIQIGDYNKDTLRLKRVLRMLRDAPINVIITALAKNQEKSDKGPGETSPALTKGLSQSIRGFMDFVWYMKIDEKADNRLLLTKTMGTTHAKTRLDEFQKAIGNVVVNPSMAKIVEQLNVCLKGAQ